MRTVQGLKCVETVSGVWANTCTTRVMPRGKNIKIETLAGIKELELIIEDGVCMSARVDIGEPELNVRKIQLYGMTIP